MKGISFQQNKEQKKKRSGPWNKYAWACSVTPAGGTSRVQTKNHKMMKGNNGALGASSVCVPVEQPWADIDQVSGGGVAGCVCPGAGRTRPCADGGLVGDTHGDLHELVKVEHGLVHGLATRP